MSIARLRDEGGILLPDHVSAEEVADHYGIRGFAEVVLKSPTDDLILRRLVSNLITQVGDQLYGEWAAGITNPPPRVTGMKLGTGTTAPAKTGAGAALAAYLAGSQKAIESGWPTSSLTADATPKRRIQFKGAWAAGVATHNAITEVALVNEALADATSLAAATVARILTNPGAPATGIQKNAGDTLEVIWNHELLGA